MSRLVIAALVVSLFVLGCASLRLNARQDVESPAGSLIASPYEPEDGEGCEMISQLNCRYVQNAFKTLHLSCADNLVNDGKVPEGANYVFVQEPRRVAGIQAGKPKATMYRCSELTQ